MRLGYGRLAVSHRQQNLRKLIPNKLTNLENVLALVGLNQYGQHEPSKLLYRQSGL